MSNPRPTHSCVLFFALYNILYIISFQVRRCSFLIICIRFVVYLVVVVVVYLFFFDYE